MMNNSQAILARLQAQYGSQDMSNMTINRWQYWDYARYPNAGTNQMRFFSVPLGGVDPISTLQKTYEQTNMPRAGTFGSITYIITQIRTHLFVLPKVRQPAAIADETNLLYGGTNSYVPLMNSLLDMSNQGVLGVKIGQKEYFDLDQPFRLAPFGAGVQIQQISSSGGGAFAPIGAWTQQSTNQCDIYTLAPPQLIEREQTFEVVIDFPNANSPALATIDGANPAVDIGVWFDGYIIQPVQ